MINSKFTQKKSIESVHSRSSTFIMCFSLMERVSENLIVSSLYFSGVETRYFIRNRQRNLKCMLELIEELQKNVLD